MLAGTGFLIAQEATTLEGGEAGHVVTLPTWRGNGRRRLEAAAASEERPTTELALAVQADWRAAG